MKALNPTPQSKQIQEKRQEMNVPKDQITLMQEKGKQIKQNTTLNPRLSEERKKELEVPKDQMALICEKQGRKDEATSMMKQDHDIKCGGKGCAVTASKETQLEGSPKHSEQLPEIKQQIGRQDRSTRDLLDMDASPVRIQPKMEMRDSQEQFRKQMYSEHMSNNNQRELERKQQLTPKTAQKIMNQIKNEERKSEEVKKNHKKKAHHHQHHQEIQNKNA